VWIGGLRQGARPDPDLVTEMALRLSKAVGRTPESWLTMQDNYDLWQARKSVNLDAVEKVEFRAA